MLHFFGRGAGPGLSLFFEVLQIDLAEVHMIPKHHYWIHLTMAVCEVGNERYYWNYVDEQVNGKLKRACESSLPATFCRSDSIGISQNEFLL